MGAVKAYPPRDNKGREKIIEGFKNGIEGFKNGVFPVYYDEREEFGKEEEENEEDEEDKKDEE